MTAVTLLLMLVACLLTWAVCRWRSAAERRALGESLEARFQQRSAELRESNARLEREAAGHGRAVAALQDSEARFRQLVNHLDQVFWISSPDGQQVHYVSPAVEKITGRTWEAIARLPGGFFALIHPEDRPRIQGVHDRIIASGGFDEAYRILRPDGSLRWLWSRAFVIRDEAGQITQIAGIMEDISRYKAAETALRRLNAALENAVEGISLLDRQGCYRYVNNAYAQMLGRTPAAMDSLPWQATVHPGDHPRFLAAVRRMRDAGKAEAEVRAVRQDGSTFWKQVVMVRAVDEDGVSAGHYCFAKDITRRKQAEEALHASSAELRLITAQLPSVVWVTNAQLAITHIAGGAIAATGRRPEDYLGRTLYDLYADQGPDYPPIAAHVKALGGEAAGYERTIGDRQWEVRVEPLRDDTARIIGCLSLAVDRTEHKQAEARLRQMQEQLAHMARFYLAGKLAGELAHEINQPLGAITMYADIGQKWLQSQPPALGQLGRTLEQIADQAGRAGEILRRMSSLAVKAEPQRRAVDVNGLICDTLHLLEVRVRQAGITVRTGLAKGLPPVLADPVQIRQVVLNLANNAVEAMSDAAATGKVLGLGSARADAGTVTVTVTDSGPGLPAEALDKPFRPFVSTKPDGMGLSLVISQSIIETHGGRLWATRNPQAGMAFHFTLPVAGGGASDVF
ncbi:MAG: PAS domain S-box protein [Pseudomonadota bacterium]|nr:PAS domain S-box protein [Pseudomonadota bacterium]